MVDSQKEEAAPNGKAIFLGHAFSKYLEHGETFMRRENPARRKLEWIAKKLRDEGYGVHCALEREKWGRSLMSPQAALEFDLRQVEHADCLLTYPQDSPGAITEIGFALMKHIPIVAVWKGKSLPPNFTSLHEQEFFQTIQGAIQLQQSLGLTSALLLDNSSNIRDFHQNIFPKFKRIYHKYLLCV